jgi:hypothetical protein
MRVDWYLSLFVSPLTFLQAEFAHFHYYFIIYLDGRADNHAVNMRFAVPLGAGFAGQGAAERNVHAWKFLILKQIVDQLSQAGIRTDGEFSDPVAVFIDIEKVFSQFLPELLVVASDTFYYGPAVFNLDANGCIFK